MKKIFLIACYLIIYVATFAQPNITIFSPSSGEVGSAVVITGTGFSTILNQNIVFLELLKLRLQLQVLQV